MFSLNPVAQAGQASAHKTSSPPTTGLSTEPRRRAELQLASKHPDLKFQFLHPSWERLEHDLKAVDGEPRYFLNADCGKDPNVELGERLANTLFKGTLGDTAGSQKSWSLLADTLSAAYLNSEDFRRLLHHRIDSDGEARWYVRGEGPLSAGVETDQLGAERRVLTMSLAPWQSDTDGAMYPTYDSGGSRTALEPMRAYVHLMIRVLTDLPDDESGNPLGPNGEYTNLVCKAMGYDWPACTAYESLSALSAINAPIEFATRLSTVAPANELDPGSRTSLLRLSGSKMIVDRDLEAAETLLSLSSHIVFEASRPMPIASARRPMDGASDVVIEKRPVSNPSELAATSPLFSSDAAADSRVRTLDLMRSTLAAFTEPSPVFAALAQTRLNALLTDVNVRDALLETVCGTPRALEATTRATLMQATRWWLELMSDQVAAGHMPPDKALKLVTERGKLTSAGGFAPALAARAARFHGEIGLLIQLLSTIARALPATSDEIGGHEQVRRALLKSDSPRLLGLHNAKPHFYGHLARCDARTTPGLIEHLGKMALLPDKHEYPVSRHGSLQFWKKTMHQRFTNAAERAAALDAIALPPIRQLHEIATDATATLTHALLLNIGVETQARALVDRRTKIRFAVETEVREEIRASYLKASPQASAAIKRNFQGQALVAHLIDGTGSYRDAYHAASNDLRSTPSNEEVRQFVDTQMKRPDIVAIVDASVLAAMEARSETAPHQAKAQHEVVGAISLAAKARYRDASARAAQDATRKMSALTMSDQNRTRQDIASEAKKAVTAARISMRRAEVLAPQGHHEEPREKLFRAVSPHASTWGSSNLSSHASESTRIARQLATLPPVATGPFGDIALDAMSRAPKPPRREPGSLDAQRAKLHRDH